MNMREFLNAIDQAERERFAKNAQTSVGYLWLLAGDHRRPSPKLARRLHEASGGRMTLAELRPDLWGDEVAA